MSRRSLYPRSAHDASGRIILGYYAEASLPRVLLALCRDAVCGARRQRHLRDQIRTQLAPNFVREGAMARRRAILGGGRQSWRGMRASVVLTWSVVMVAGHRLSQLSSLLVCHTQTRGINRDGCEKNPLLVVLARNIQYSSKLVVKTQQKTSKCWLCAEGSAHP